MAQYFTSIEVIDGTFVGVAYNSTTNKEIYRSSPYRSQLQALMDVTEFLKTQTPSNPANIRANTPQQQTITNTATLHPAPQVPGRCCGR